MKINDKKRIRIRLKAYDSKVLDESCSQIVDIAEQNSTRLSGPIPLPTKRRVYCVLRSPHVDKASREHFELRIHKRLIDIYDPSSTMVGALIDLDLGSDVDVEIKL